MTPSSSFMPSRLVLANERRVVRTRSSEQRQRACKARGSCRISPSAWLLPYISFGSRCVDSQLLICMRGLSNLMQQFSFLSLLLICNLLASGVRFWRVLHHFGMKLSLPFHCQRVWRGTWAGLFFIPLLGHVAGRQLVLQQYGVPSVLNSSLSAYERLSCCN